MDKQNEDNNDLPKRRPGLKSVMNSTGFGIVLMFFFAMLLFGENFQDGYWFLWFLLMLGLFLLMPKLKRRQRSRAARRNRK